MLEKGLGKGVVTWRSMGEPGGFEEAALFIERNELADNIGFIRTNGRITTVFMSVNENGKDFIKAMRG